MQQQVGENSCLLLFFILGSIAKSTNLQYRQFIAGGGFATKSRRSYCPRKAYGFAAAFSGIANNTVVCNRGQYITWYAFEESVLSDERQLWSECFP